MAVVGSDREKANTALTGKIPAGELTSLARSGARPRLIWWRKRNLIVGALMIAIIVVVAVFAPAIAPYGPLETDYTARLQTPGPKHPFGTDNLGRDIFSRVLYGASIDLQVGLISVLLPFLIGGVLGCLAGFYGGRIDALVMRVWGVRLGFLFLLFIFVDC